MSIKIEVITLNHAMRARVLCVCMCVRVGLFVSAAEALRAAFQKAALASQISDLARCASISDRGVLRKIYDLILCVYAMFLGLEAGNTFMNDFDLMFEVKILSPTQFRP